KKKIRWDPVRRRFIQSCPIIRIPNRFLRGHRPPPARSGHRCVADNTNLYVFGGYNPDYDESGGPDNEDYPLFRELWRYHFATGVWHQMGTDGYMPRELASMSLVLHGNNLLVFGGTGIPFGESNGNDVHVCNVKYKRWALLSCRGKKPSRIYGQAMAIINGSLYVFGGTTGYIYSTDLHKLDLNTREWTQLKPNNLSCDLPEERYRHEIAHDGQRIYILGGDWQAKTRPKGQRREPKSASLQGRVHENFHPPVTRRQARGPGWLLRKFFQKGFRGREVTPGFAGFGVGSSRPGAVKPEARVVRAAGGSPRPARGWFLPQSLTKVNRREEERRLCFHGNPEPRGQALWFSGMCGGDFGEKKRFPGKATGRKDPPMHTVGKPFQGQLNLGTTTEVGSGPEDRCHLKQATVVRLQYAGRTSSCSTVPPLGGRLTPAWECDCWKGILAAATENMDAGKKRVQPGVAATGLPEQTLPAVPTESGSGGEGPGALAARVSRGGHSGRGLGRDQTTPTLPSPSQPGQRSFWQQNGKPK
ncbi:hypothetical protein H8959_007445, partial [Pygathrix nigripes]